MNIFNHNIENPILEKNACRYRITENIGWGLCISAIYIFFMNNDHPFSYIFLGFSTCWLFLAKSLPSGRYRITKTIGWVLCVLAIYGIFMSYDHFLSYIFAGYSICWIFLAKSLTSGAKYKRMLLLCLQAITITGIGYWLEHWLCIYIYDSFENGAAAVFGPIIVFPVWSMLLASFLEIILSRRSKVLAVGQMKEEPHSQI